MSIRKPAGLTRRDFSRYTLGAGAALSMAGRAGIARASSPASALGSPAVRAESLGINEAFKARAFGNKTGAGWTRWTVQWFNVQQQPGDLNVHYFRDNRGQSILERQVNDGMKVAAMVLGTPEWAAEVPGLKTGTSVPRGLYAPTMVGMEPNPENPWAVFMFNLAKSYAGLMDVFEIWNEVEIPTGGSNAQYNTWAGTAEQYYQLVKVAAEAAKSANPNAKIITSPYSYFKDGEEGKGVNPEMPHLGPLTNQFLPFWDEFERSVKADPGASALVDGIALNLYRNPHDLWDRVWGAIPGYFGRADQKGFRARLADMGLPGKELWLTEFNAMPFEAGLKEQDGFRIALNEQAHYVLQSHAIIAAAGWNKAFWQALQDDQVSGDELWGLVRYNDNPDNEDESRLRPSYGAYQLATATLGDVDNADLYVRYRADNPRDKYRQYASRYKWGAHAVAADKGAQRSYALWAGGSNPEPVSIKAWGAEAVLYRPDAAGNYIPEPIAAQGGRYNLNLPGATRRFELFGGDPPGYHYIGGATYLLIENGVPAGANVEIQGFSKKERRPDTPADEDARD